MESLVEARACQILRYRVPYRKLDEISGEAWLVLLERWR
jgi:hypothetical protein